MNRSDYTRQADSVERVNQIVTCFGRPKPTQTREIDNFSRGWKQTKL